MICKCGHSSQEHAHNKGDSAGACKTYLCFCRTFESPKSDLIRALEDTPTSALIFMIESNHHAALQTCDAMRNQLAVFYKRVEEKTNVRDMPISDLIREAGKLLRLRRSC